jgi:hypothetical protein
VRSRTAGVMTTLMRNDRDRRLGKPVKGHAILERMLLVGARSADHIRASGHSGCIAMEVTPPCENRPDTWLHPNASQKARFLLHRGRRPYMAPLYGPAARCKPKMMIWKVGASIRDRLIALALYRMVSAPTEADDAHPQSHSNANPISLLERLYRLRLVSAGILWRAG